MLVALQRFDLRIPMCGSLNAKRHVVKSLSAAIRSRFNVSVAEVGYQDLWQRTELAVAAADPEQFHVRKVMQQVEKLVEGWPEVDVIDSDLELFWPEA